MQAIILAGGRGTRLKPYTMSFPKPLVPVGDHPILEIIIRQLRAQGFRKVIISTGHLAELIQAYFGNGDHWDIEIDYVREDKALNTAGSLKLVKNWDEHVLVMNGDILTSLDYRQLVATHIQHMAQASVAITKRESRIDFGIVETDQEGFLTHYREKPVHTYNVSMGVYVLSRSCQDLIGEGEALGMPDLLLRVMQAQQRVYCHNTDCYWLDIGRVDDYEEAQLQFQSNPQKFLPHGI